MSINGELINNQISSYNKINDNQTGFTQESQIEDNLFIVQYCIKDSFKRKKAFIVFGFPLDPSENWVPPLRSRLCPQEIQHT